MEKSRKLRISNKGGKVKKGKFSQKKVNDFFEKSRVLGNSFLEEQLRNAKTEAEKKRIRKLLKDFS